MSDNKTNENTEAPGVRTESPLSPHRAFVVQFRGETAVAHGHVSGRIEHIVSGQATRFHSLEELLAFLERVLTNVQEGSP